MTSQPSPVGRDPVPSPAPDQTAQGSVWWYLNVVLRRRHMILTLAVATGMLAGILTFFSPRQYAAHASFVPQEPSSNQGGLGQLATQFGLVAARAATTSPQFYADLLRSRDVLRDLVTTDYGAAAGAGVPGNLIRYFGIGSPDSSLAAWKAVEQFRKILSAETDRVTGVVSFDLHTKSPALSLLVANRLLELVNDYNLRRRQSQARAEREFVEQSLASARQELAAAEDAVASFLLRNRRFNDSPELVAQLDRLQRQVAFRQQLYLTLSQNYEAAKIEEVRSTPVITVIEKPGTFAEPLRRGSVRRAVIGFLGGALLGLLVAYLSESLAIARLTQASDYAGFVNLRQEMGEELKTVRRLWRRR